MPYKDPEKRREYRQKYYEKNRSDWRRRNNERRRSLRQIVLEWKLKNPCVVCGESDPLVIDPHHVDMSTKDESISKLVTDIRSPERIRNELAKCVGMCCNCHRRHHNGGNGN